MQSSRSYMLEMTAVSAVGKEPVDLAGVREHLGACQRPYVLMDSFPLGIGDR